MTAFHLANVFAELPSLLAAPGAPAPAVAEAQLRALNHRHISAFAAADGDVMHALLAADFLLTSITGEWLDREQYLARMRSPSIVGGVAYDQLSVRLFGSVGLVHGLLEASGDQGAAMCVRYTDVYHWSGVSWQLASAQHTLLRPGVSRQCERGQAPACAPWPGVDPVGDDLEVLRELNASYVRAFREADVSWYEAHLAQDYLVINSDGSLHDRARGLAEFAKPVFATYMRSFPVDRVRVRRLGDFALVHAENAYERNDGLRGVNRYTDCWQRQADGGWRCVAAHITTHKPLH